MQFSLSISSHELAMLDVDYDVPSIIPSDSYFSSSVLLVLQSA